MYSKKASTSSYDGSDNAKHHDAIQVLCPIRNYHFGDVCFCFTKDAESYPFIQCFLKLLIIQYEGKYNLKKMTEDQMIAHVTQLHEAQQSKKDEEEIIATAAEKDNAAFV